MFYAITNQKSYLCKLLSQDEILTLANEILKDRVHPVIVVDHEQISEILQGAESLNLEKNVYFIDYLQTSSRDLEQIGKFVKFDIEDSLIGVCLDNVSTDQVIEGVKVYYHFAHFGKRKYIIPAVVALTFKQGV